VSLLSEIIVVDDGSVDDTYAVAQQVAQSDSRLQVLRHTTNQGKGQAVFTGCLAVRAPLLVMVDADLMGLRPEQIGDLIRPVIAGQVDMTVGLFRRGRFPTDFSHAATPWLSGQRGLRTEMMAKVPTAAAQGYGLEMALTVAAARQDWRVRYIPMDGVWHPPSESHRGLWRGIKNRARMYHHIWQAWRLAGGQGMPLARLLPCFTPALRKE
jgi:glycosyltransferase involved in cell wall biosynthesis